MDLQVDTAHPALHRLAIALDRVRRDYVQNSAVQSGFHHGTVRHSCRDRAATPVWAMPMPVRCGAIRFSASLRQDSCRQDSCRQDSSQQTACRQAMPMAPTGCASRMNRPIAARLSMPGRAAAIPVAQLRARPRSVRFHKESRCPRRITAEASEFADLPVAQLQKRNRFPPVAGEDRCPTQNRNVNNPNSPPQACPTDRRKTGRSPISGSAPCAYRPA